MYSGPLFIASDHAGFALKKRLIRYLKNELKLSVEDMGAKEPEPDDDFPDYIIPATQKAVEMKGRVIVVGGSGNGEAIAANKIKGMRCAVVHSIETAELSRADNDANGVAFGARVSTPEHTMVMLKKWLETDFKGGKYQRRNDKITKFEETNILSFPRRRESSLNI